MQIKKPLCIFLAFFILVSNIGYALNVHYCDNQIASVSFNTVSPSNLEEDCCGAVAKTSHCCKDRIVVLQQKSDQALIKSISFEAHNMVFEQEWFAVLSTAEIPSQKSNVVAYYCNSNAPPLFKLYSQYIFYDKV